MSLDFELKKGFSHSSCTPSSFLSPSRTKDGAGINTHIGLEGPMSPELAPCTGKGEEQNLLLVTTCDLKEAGAYFMIFKGRSNIVTYPKSSHHYEDS